VRESHRPEVRQVLAPDALRFLYIVDVVRERDVGGNAVIAEWDEAALLYQGLEAFDLGRDRLRPAAGGLTVGRAAIEYGCQTDSRRGG